MNTQQTPDEMLNANTVFVTTEQLEIARDIERNRLRYKANKAQHSPLPWSVQIPPSSCLTDRFIVDGMGNTVAEIGGRYSLPSEPIVAIDNAKLIVRAVNAHAEALLMAEALRVIRDRNSEFSPDYQTANEALIKWERANQ